MSKIFQFEFEFEFESTCVINKSQNEMISNFDVMKENLDFNNLK